MRLRPVPWLLGASLLAAAPLSAFERPSERRLSRLVVPFVANQGQADSRIAFSASTFAGAVFVTREGRIVHSLPALEGVGWSLTETLVGGTPSPAGQEPSPTRVSSFLGADSSRWRSALPAYGSVGLGEVWKGIEVSLVARGDEVEKLFTVAPGAASESIRVRVAGAKSLQVDPDGRLLAKTGRGDVAFSAPVAYQEKSGERSPVAVAYRARGNEYGFHLGAFDPALPVVIDPVLQSTFLGGSGNDFVYHLTFHPTSGEVYAVGTTLSTNFPGTAGGAQPASAGSNDAFVARFNASLTSLLQATYLGGSAYDAASAVAIHPISGEVYVYGQTASVNFPMTAGGTQSANAGAQDAFVMRLNAALTSPLQATYYGGSTGGLANESATVSLAIHPTSGEIYFAGFTQSTNLPGTTGGAQPANAGFVDGYIVRLSASLTGPILQATYLGGFVADQLFSLTLVPSAGVYVTGSTNSPDFPGTAGGAQPAIAPGFGNTDTFVARLNIALTSVTQSTYFGGNALDTSFGVAVHPTSGDVYIAGGTSSTDLPGTAGGAQPAIAGPSDSHVARFNASLTSLLQATYRGGSSGEGANAVTIHPTSGDVYITGITVSGDYPGTAGGAQAVFGGGGGDIFISRFNSTLTSPLNPSTFLGGSQDDEAISIRVHPTSGEVYVGGYTLSSNFPTLAGGAQPVYGGGGSDGVLSRLTPDLAATGGGYFTVTPCRVIDTRDPVGPYGGPALAAGASRSVVFAGQCGIPVTARALAFNLTITLPTDQGHLRVFPTGAMLPLISMMNYRAGQSRANNGISTLGPSGDLTIFSGQATGTVHFIVDVVGYFQ